VRGAITTGLSDLVRDERTVVIEGASYRFAYLIVTFALPVDVTYRRPVRREASFDLLAIVVVGGTISALDQWPHQILTLHSAKLALYKGVVAGIIAAWLQPCDWWVDVPRPTTSRQRVNTMARFVIFSLALLSPTMTLAADPDAKQLAQDILTKGAALFDSRDAAAIAATYTDDAEVTLVIKDKDSGKYKTEVTRGRSAIERGYRDIFKDRKAGTTSRNVVEYAHFVGTDLLIIHGTFTLDVNHEGAFPFVQVRSKQGDKWLLMSLQLFVVPEKSG
jgi:ketosteroid isomerase-like protein